MTLRTAHKKSERSIVPSFKLQQACEGKAPCPSRLQFQQHIYFSEQEREVPNWKKTQKESTSQLNNININMHVQ
jgi:hypothetical protein